MVVGHSGAAANHELVVVVARVPGEADFGAVVTVVGVVQVLHGLQRRIDQRPVRGGSGHGQIRVGAGFAMPWRLDLVAESSIKAQRRRCLPVMLQVRIDGLRAEVSRRQRYQAGRRIHRLRFKERRIVRQVPKPGEGVIRADAAIQIVVILLPANATAKPDRVRSERMGDLVGDLDCVLRLCRGHGAAALHPIVDVVDRQVLNVGVGDAEVDAAEVLRAVIDKSRAVRAKLVQPGGRKGVDVDERRGRVERLERDIADRARNIVRTGQVIELRKKEGAGDEVLFAWPGSPRAPGTGCRESGPARSTAPA